MGPSSVFLRVFRFVFLLLAVEQVAEHRCHRVVVLRDGVGVPVERDARAGMAEPGLDGLHVDTVGQKQRGLCVAELVELEPVEAVLLAPDPPPMAEVVDADAAARARAAHRRLVGLLDADLGGLFCLAVLPHAEVIDSRGVDGYGADARVGLRGLDHVLVGDVVTDVDGALVEVDVSPCEREHLAPALTRGQADANGHDAADVVKPAHEVALLRDAELLAVCTAGLLLVERLEGFRLGLVNGGEQRGALFSGECAAVGLVAAGCRDARAGVPVDVVVVDALLEDVLEQGVDLVHRRAGKAGLLADGGVGLLDYLDGDVLDGHVAQMALHVAQTVAVLRERALGCLAGGAAGGVPQLDELGEGHVVDLLLLLLLLDHLVKDLALAVELGDELVALLVGVGLGALHDAGDALALLLGAAVFLLLVIGERQADAPVLGVEALAVAALLLGYASSCESHLVRGC